MIYNVILNINNNFSSHFPCPVRFEGFVLAAATLSAFVKIALNPSGPVLGAKRGVLNTSPPVLFVSLAM